MDDFDFLGDGSGMHGDRQEDYIGEFPVMCSVCDNATEDSAFECEDCHGRICDGCLNPIEKNTGMCLDCQHKLIEEE